MKILRKEKANRYLSTLLFSFINFNRKKTVWHQSPFCNIHKIVVHSSQMDLHSLHSSGSNFIIICFVCFPRSDNVWWPSCDCSQQLENWIEIKISFQFCLWNVFKFRKIRNIWVRQRNPHNNKLCSVCICVLIFLSVCSSELQLVLLFIALKSEGSGNSCPVGYTRDKNGDCTGMKP